MILKALGKLSISGGILSGAVLVDNVANNISENVKKKIEKSVDEINSFEDIELFEKINGCRFVYVRSWDKKDLYGARKFVEEEEKVKSDETNWTSKVVKGKYWNKAKNWCRENKGATITLFYGSDTQEFALTDPPKGW